MMEIYPSKKYDLIKLQKWLDYELSGSALVFLSWLWGFLLLLVMLAAVVFIPFMLKVLFAEKKYGWLITFFILVILPAVIIAFINVDFITRTILAYIPLAMFLFYCFILKMAVRDWVAESEFLRSSLEEESSLLPPN